MKNNFKFLVFGILGGMIPFAILWALNLNSNKANDSIFDGQLSNNNIHRTAALGSYAPMTDDFVAASENSINSVVHVTTKVVRTSFQRDPFYEFFYGPGSGGKELKQYGQGSGSGVIVSTQGYIVTNYHVIEDASEVKVILNDNSQYDAVVVGTDPATDIAVLKISAEDLIAMPIGNSDDVRVGEWVLAVGNPFNLTSTVTAGIVSAKARNINLLAERSSQEVVPIESFIQTDAAVNPGNSGGALVNTKGELIGINTAIASQTGSYAGYSFAVPVNLVQKVMSDLIDYGIVQRGFIGVQIADVNQELKEQNNLPNTAGVYVNGVTDKGSAEKAGIKQGDVILKIGSRTINSVATLQEEIGRRRPGDKIAVTIRNKNGQEEIKEIVLRNSSGETSLVSKKEIEKNMALGATFEELSSKEKNELKITSGVKIKTLSTGKLKALGLTEGMIITKVNNEAVENVEQLTAKLNNASTKGILLEVMNETGKKDYVGFGL